MSVIVEDWPTREAFEAWRMANVREFNAMAIDPPPIIHGRSIEVVNPEWHRIAIHIDRWKTRHGL